MYVSYWENYDSYIAIQCNTMRRTDNLVLCFDKETICIIIRDEQRVSVTNVSSLNKLIMHDIDETKPILFKLGSSISSKFFFLEVQ